MPPPTSYHSSLLPAPLIFLPQTGIVYLESEPFSIFFVHGPAMVDLITRTIRHEGGDIDIARRFGKHWAVIRVLARCSVTAFTVWGHDCTATLARIRVLQRLARARPGARARRANEVAKLGAFKSEAARALPADLVQLILAACVRAPREPAPAPAGVCRVETVSYGRLHGARRT